MTFPTMATYKSNSVRELSSSTDPAVGTSGVQLVSTMYEVEKSARALWVAASRPSDIQDGQVWTKDSSGTLYFYRYDAANNTDRLIGQQTWSGDYRFLPSAAVVKSDVMNETAGTVPMTGALRHYTTIFNWFAILYPQTINVVSTEWSYRVSGVSAIGSGEYQVDLMQECAVHTFASNSNTPYSAPFISFFETRAGNQYAASATITSRATTYVRFALRDYSGNAITTSTNLPARVFIGGPTQEA